MGEIEGCVVWRRIEWVPEVRCLVLQMDVWWKISFRAFALFRQVGWLPVQFVDSSYDESSLWIDF